MKKIRREYGNYKGRATITDKLRVVAAVLLVLVVLAAAGLFWGQRSLVQTDQGLRLELPFLQREEQPKSYQGEMEGIQAAESDQGEKN